MTDSIPQRGEIYRRISHELRNLRHIRACQEMANLAQGNSLESLDESVITVTILANLPIIIADLDDGKIVYVSRMAEEMFGYFVRGELLGKSVDELLPEALRSKHVEHRKTFANKPVARAMGHRLMPLCGSRKDGSVLKVEIGLSAAMVAGKPCAIAVVLDMSQRHGGPGENLQ